MTHAAPQVSTDIIQQDDRIHYCLTDAVLKKKKKKVKTHNTNVICFYGHHAVLKYNVCHKTRR